MADPRTKPAMIHQRAARHRNYKYTKFAEELPSAIEDLGCNVDKCMSAAVCSTFVNIAVNYWGGAALSSKINKDD